MSVAQYEYYFSVTGTEKEFMSGLITYLHNLDNKIVCTSSVDTEFDPSDTSHVPTFNFTIDDTFPFTLKRYKVVSGSGVDAPLSDDACGYMASFGSLVVGITFSAGTAYAYTTSATRGYYISSLTNDDFVLLLINTTSRAWTSQLMNDNMSIVYCKSGTKSYYSIGNNIDRSAKANIFNMGTRTFCDNSDPSGISGTFTSRFSYVSPPGKIDYIKSSVYLNNGQKKFDMSCIYDCTTVTVCDTVSLKDGPYYAVGSNQLVKIVQ